MPTSDASTPVAAVDELQLGSGAAPAAHRLASAATALDPAAMVDVLAGSIRSTGVLATWDRVICPVLQALGQLPFDTGEQIAVERMLTRAVSEAFASVRRPASGIRDRVLLACADGEQHTLALQAAAAATTELGMPSCSLGAGIPPRALHSAVRRISPAVTVVWSQTAATADPAHVTPLLIDRPRRTLIAAGPGWTTVALPDTVVRPTNLFQVVGAVLHVITAEARPTRP